MRKKVLIIINTQFPYEKSEDFLYNELKYIDGFDEIICFPIMINGQKNFDDIIYKELDKKILFYNCTYSPKSIPRVFKLIYLIIREKTTYTELKNLFLTKRLNWLNLKRLFLFLLIANNVIDDLWNKLNESHSNSSIVFYSYWMHIGAFVAISLKEKFVNVEKIITRCHRFDLYEYANEGNYLPMRKFIFSNVNEIHSISEDGLLYLKNKYSINNDKLFISRLGTIDRGVYIYPKNQILHLVSCSWMRPVKRISSIVNSISTIQINLNWVHYGDGEEYNYIMDLIKQIDNPLVRCRLMGAYTNERLLVEYTKNACDVFINVSENEGVPVSIMEAMSFGKIIIATDVGGTSEIVINGVNGFLLNRNFTNQDLVMAITKVAALDVDEFSLMCQQSRRIWDEKCNADINFKSFYEKINSVD